MSDTPRTDKVTRTYGDASVEWEEELVPVDACRATERELNGANSEIERLRKANFQLREGAEEQKQRIKQLEEAGDALKAAGYFGGFNDAVNKWVKVREGKP